MLLDVLGGFIQELRAAGIPVSMVESIDAMEALRHTDLGDRSAFKAALGATLVKNQRHYEAFEVAFEVYFALSRSGLAPNDDTKSPALQGEGSGQGSGGEAALEDLLRTLAQALAAQDTAGIRQLARTAVDDLAGMEPGRPVGGTYYLYRTLRQLDIDELFEQLVAEALASAGGVISEFEEQLIREDIEARIDQLRDEIKAEIRRRLVADRGAEAVAKTLRKPLIEDIELMHATRADLAELEHVVQPLTRKLAARLARRRRLRRDGRLDFRRTVRKSLATGGVPIEPQFRAPKPSKPEVILLCDISGSMATFARFALQFVYAMSNEFSKLRAFAFIDALDEVTSHFNRETEFSDMLHRISSEAQVVWLDGHSDYGRSLEQFWTRYGDSLTPKSTVIITGDARSNYRDPQADVLEQIHGVARAVYWLNPEPRSYWNTGDSVMGKYAVFCDEVFEVRNLRQLERFVEEIAEPGRRRVRLHKAG